jgi:hypothetical protein
MTDPDMIALVLAEACAHCTLDQMEAGLLTCPQADTTTSHYFGPGIYIREVVLPADAIVLGHAHRAECMNMLVKGKMAILEDGAIRVLEAPFMFVSPPGRKLAYIIEEVVFQNIIATTETDVDVLEDLIVERSPVWEAHRAKQLMQPEDT